MWYWHNGMGAGGWAFMIVNMVLFWALIVAGIVLLVRLVGRNGRSSGEPPQGRGGSEAEQVLANRFARGEIDEDEYRRRLQALRGAPTGPR